MTDGVGNPVWLYSEIPLEEQNFEGYGNNMAQEMHIVGQKAWTDNGLAQNQNQMTFGTIPEEPSPPFCTGENPNFFNYSNLNQKTIFEYECPPEPFPPHELPCQFVNDQPMQATENPSFQPTSASGLMELDYVHPERMHEAIPFVGGNNQESFYIPDNSVGGLHGNWTSILPPDIAERDEKKDAQMERNRGYAAVCLRKKRDMLKKLEKSSTTLIVDFEGQKLEAKRKRAHMCFAVEHVLNPILGDNNLGNNEPNGEIAQLARQLQFEESKVQQEIEFERSSDQELIAAANNLELAKKKWDNAEYEKKEAQRIQKAFPDAILKVPMGTLGSRCSRAKHEYFVSFYCNQIAWYSHDLEQQRRLLTIYDKFWATIRPMTCDVLKAFHGRIEEMCRQNNVIDKLQEFRFFLLEDAG